ncbi:histone deacetylase [Aliihoeflea sp. 40Bstr573]|uniref:histone deacetylase family protein n=1 Tax=Aliihoeflea sp. 40Bstr573 TaxID=2696467 RepID=UPI002094D7F0|nr:histone deacetylase [Aliihoeflea sp. 40Bstr573]MCO6389068.1 histone deacetylase [Aliihoeflea sp. 40Bstr573]
MKLPIVHHPDYDARFPADHRFPMSKYARLIEVLRERGVARPDNEHVPDLPGFETLARAHAGDYVRQVMDCAVPPAIEKEIGFAVSERVSRRAQLASSGTLLAARLALDHGIACNAAGGSHHARHAQGAGFCTFNDVAIAAHALLAEGAIKRALVVDLDVHQGDGTAEILMGENRVFTFSMHAARNYPVRKAVSDFDIALDDGVEDEAYLARLTAILPLVDDYSRPQIVFYNAGVDPHGDDKLGRLALSDDGILARDRAVIGHFRERGIPVCGVIGGGYSNDIDALAARHAILFDTAVAFA